MIKKTKKQNFPPAPGAGQKMTWWNSVPQAVVDIIEDNFGKISSEKIADNFNPSDPWFAISTWDHGMVVDSMKTSSEVEDLINEKLNRDTDDAFDLSIYDSSGQEYTWQVNITLVKI